MHTHMHTHLPQHTDTHISFFPRLWNPVQSPTPVPSLISLTQVLHMLRLYVICVWFYVIWCCSLVASDFSSKILSPWVLSSAYLPPPQRSLAGPSVYGILQARILEWVAIPSLGDFPNPGLKPVSPTLQADSLPTKPWGKHYY